MPFQVKRPDLDVPPTSSGGRLETRQLRQKYRSLISRTQQSDDFLGQEGNSALMATMEEADSLLKSVNAPQECSLDAEVFKNIMHITEQNAREIGGGGNGGSSFSATEFATRIADVLLKATLTDEDEPVVQASAEKWVAFGRMVAPCFARAPAMHYLFGSVDRDLGKSAGQEPESKKVKVTKQRQQPQQQPRGPATKVSKAVMKQKEEDNVDYLVRQVYKVLLDECKRQAKREIDFFQFTLDPTSFGQSMENIFYVSHLVKERKVFVAEKKEGLPTIGPMRVASAASAASASSQDKLESKSDQIIMSMNMKQWNELVEVLDIKRATIPTRTGEHE